MSSDIKLNIKCFNILTAQNQIEMTGFHKQNFKFECNFPLKKGFSILRNQKIVPKTK